MKQLAIALLVLAVIVLMMAAVSCDHLPHVTRLDDLGDTDADPCSGPTLSQMRESHSQTKK